jgi:hypothetical protein
MLFDRLWLERRGLAGRRGYGFCGFEGFYRTAATDTAAVKVDGYTSLHKSRLLCCWAAEMEKVREAG